MNQTQTTPPGLPRWPAGFCATGNLDSSAVPSSAQAVEPPGQAQRREWRFRFTLCTLLVAVFAIAVALAAVVACRKRAEWLTQLATKHAAKAQECADAGWGLQRFGLQSLERDAQVRSFWQLYEQHKEFSSRCQQAVWRPWVSIGNEPPPEPEK